MKVLAPIKKVFSFVRFAKQLNNSEMKQIKQLGLVLFVAVMATACSKEKRLTNRIEGSWTLTKQEITANTVTTTLTPSASNFTFNDDKSGSYSITFSENGQSITDAGSFTWANTKDQVTINETSNGQTTSTVYKVDKDEKKHQEWSNTSNNTTTKLYLDKK